jgi:hypothetical protein
MCVKALGNALLSTSCETTIAHTRLSVRIGRKTAALHRAGGHLEWLRQTIMPLSERSLQIVEQTRSLFDWFRDTTGCAQAHFSEFGHLGGVGFKCPLSILRLDFDHISEMPGTEELLPRMKDILPTPLREVGHLSGEGLKPFVGCLLNFLSCPASLLFHPFGVCHSDLLFTVLTNCHPRGSFNRSKRGPHQTDLIRSQ